MEAPTEYGLCWVCQRRITQRSAVWLDDNDSVQCCKKCWLEIAPAKRLEIGLAFQDRTERGLGVAETLDLIRDLIANSISGYFNKFDDPGGRLQLKILFHANREHGQAAAVWRCRELLQQAGIELLHTDESPLPGRVDLDLVHTQYIENNPEYLPRLLTTGETPIVLLERIDGAQLTGPVRAVIRNPRVRAVIKNTIYKTPALYNSAYWRAHEATICNPGGHPYHAALGQMQWERVRIGDEEYNKLKLGFSFAAYPHYDPIRDVEPADWPSFREYDLNFCGTVNYGGNLKWLNAHRQSAVDAIRATPGVHICWAERRFQFDEYFQLMRRCRTVVSPWGLGKPCYRDFEAVLCGCWLVKPDTTYIETIPRGFYSFPNVRECKPDFSDLAAAAPGKPLGWDQAILCARRVSDENSTPAIATRLAGIFRGALE